MDVLSEVLKSVKLDGAMFFNAEFSAPWCARSVNGCDVTSYLSPKSQHVIIFHLLTQGSGYARLEGMEERSISLKAGDILIVPHGDGHLLGNGPPVTPVDRSLVIKQVLSQGLKVTRMGGGGDVTKFICGYMSCEPQLGRVFLAGLPPILKVRIRDDASGQASGQWLEQSIRHTVDTLDASKPGTKAVLGSVDGVKPTLQTILSALEDAFGRGEKRLDFGGGPQPYKLRFADSEAPLAWLTLRPRTARYPLTWAQTVRGDLRFWAVSAVRKLPDERREQLKRLLRR